MLACAGFLAVRAIFLAAFSISCEAAAVTAGQRSLFYVFGGEGIHIIEPESTTIQRFIGAKGVCTSRKEHRYYRHNCSFGGVTVVKDELIFVSDTLGKRIHVIDVNKEEIIDTIETDGEPFDLYYLDWLKEVWVHTWTNATFDVINTAGGLKKTYSAIKAHVQPGWTHGYMYADQQVKEGKVGYITHLFNPGLHQLDLETKTYKSFINVSSYGCTGTLHFVYSSVNKHGFFECRGSSNEVLEIDIASDKIVRKWNMTGVPYASPDGKCIVSLHMIRNETSNLLVDSKVYVLVISGRDSTPTLHPVISVPGGVSDLAFRPKQGKPNRFLVLISLIYSDKIAVLDLDLLRSSDSPKLTYIEGVGSVMTAPGMHAVRRPILAADGWIVSPATANNSVAVINAETRQLHGMVSGVVAGQLVVVVKPKPLPDKDASGSNHPLKGMLLASLLSAMLAVNTAE